MGCSPSKPADDITAKFRSKQIDRNIKEDSKLLDNEVKLLLLGAGESGKSTIAKQMKILFKDGYSEQERKNYRPIVFENVIQSIVTIIRAMSRLQIEFEDSVRLKDANLVLQAGQTMSKTTNSNFELKGEIGAAVSRLWDDKDVKKCFGYASEFQLSDSAEYYLEALSRLCRKDYLPTEQDILRTRVKTTGITEIQFNYKNLKFRLIDVGGQRSERKKWIHCFEDVTAIIFCAAMSAYDLLLAEDAKTNRMQESITLFETVCNNPWFRSTSMILFLNKRDLFQKKIKNTPLSECFPEYTGENNYDQASLYIQKQFEDVNCDVEKMIFTHFTCATDSSNVQFVFDAVSDVLLANILGDLGLMTH